MTRLEALKIARIVYSEVDALKQKWKGYGAIDYLPIDLLWDGRISVYGNTFEWHELEQMDEGN